jgi:23S rRNA (uracil1939-C5)-methyltransferase
VIATIRIDTIAAGGDGVGRSNGLVVFVPRTAPGDLVTADIEPRGRFARAIAHELVSQSPDRVDPPCRHYTHDACGGCQLQHIRYSAQLAAKQRIIRDALQRIGRREAPLPFIRPSADEWRYRSKLTLAIRRRRSSWIAGLHRFDDPRRIFALSDCPITRREIVRVWRDVLAASGHFPEARDLRGSVRAAQDGFAFLLIGGEQWDKHRELFEAVGALSALWWKPHGAAPRLLHSRPGGRANSAEASEAGAAFAQVNPVVAAELHKHVIERTLAHAPQHVVDAYAGTGATAVPLAEADVRVTAIELDSHAVKALSRRLSPPHRVIAGRVEEHLPNVLPAEVVVLNPPRAGVSEAVAQALESSEAAPRAVIYVSCNPATLARDVSRLQRYRIESIVAFDMFPQTAHVETVCELVPSS